jgi:acyl carrier protein
MDQIKIKICQLIKDKLGKDVGNANSEASFRDDLEVDSLDFIELIREVEKKFNIAIPDEAYDKLKTVGALTAYVTKYADKELLAVQQYELIEED